MDRSRRSGSFGHTIEGGTMRARSLQLVVIVLVIVSAMSLAGAAGATTSRGGNASITFALPAGNAVQQWDQLAADTVVKSGTTQIEGFQYMAYVSGAVYNAVVSIQGGFKSWGPRIKSPAGASADAAAVEAAYQTLAHFFPTPRVAGSPDLEAAYAESLAAIADGRAKTDGMAVGRK